MPGTPVGIAGFGSSALTCAVPATEVRFGSLFTRPASVLGVCKSAAAAGWEDAAPAKFSETALAVSGLSTGVLPDLDLPEDLAFRPKRKRNLPLLGCSSS